MDFVDSVVDAAEVLLGFSQELEMVDLILQNMNPWQRNHFVFSKRPKAMGELYALGGELSVVASSQRLDALGTVPSASGSSGYSLSHSNRSGPKGGRCWNCRVMA